MILSIVIPVFNEVKAIEEVLSSVFSAPLPKGWSKEIIIVNDGSTDGTGLVLNKYDGQIKLVNRSKNGGKGAAIKDGFILAEGEYIIIQDADLEYNPQDYVKLLEPIITKKTEVVFGSRVLGRNIVSYSRVYFYGGILLTKVFNLLHRTSLTDLATCYKVFPKRFRDELVKFPSNDFTFDVVELSHYLANNSSITEVPISYQPRSKGQGKKLSFKHGIRCFKKVISLYVSSK